MQDEQELPPQHETPGAVGVQWRRIGSRVRAEVGVDGYSTWRSSPSFHSSQRTRPFGRRTHPESGKVRRRTGVIASFSTTPSSNTGTDAGIHQQ
jgi:hypothetical protein